MERGRRGVRVLGPDEAGRPCPYCSGPTLVRHHAYEEGIVLVLARVDWCRRCQRDVGPPGSSP